jgi:hypothetical protein
MDTTQTKQQLVERIRQERAAWEALLAEVGQERMSQPGAMGDWTFKDAVAHLTAWWLREVMRLDAAQSGEQPTAPWPEDWDVETVNQQVYNANKDRPLQEVLHDASEVWQHLEDLVQALPERDLTEPGRFAWMEGQALGPAILDDFTGHFHEEHEPLIRAWLARTTEPSAQMAERTVEH